MPLSISVPQTAKPSTSHINKSQLFKRASFLSSEGLPPYSNVGLVSSQMSTKSTKDSKSIAARLESANTDLCCACRSKNQTEKPNSSNIDNLLEKKILEIEEKLREEFNREKECLLEHFNYVLQNEQARTSCMLREARRERKEKISALQQQLECKNMAGLMYVMCAERTKCKVEKMKIIESFTNYIEMLNEILNDGQALILNLSRGYKTAARVDYEWREKMQKIIGEFLTYIFNFSGSPPEQNQYLFDLPNLLKCDAPTKDNLAEDPIESALESEEFGEQSEYNESEELPEDLKWWQQQDQKCRPFAVYGDISQFKPPQRREALKKVKAAKTAPRKWQQYVFHDMFLNSDCPNKEFMKNEYFNRIPETNWLECRARTGSPIDINEEQNQPLQAAVEIKATMGSILKMVTIPGVNDNKPNVPKTNILAAKDSMEILSTTKLQQHNIGEKQPTYGPPGAIEERPGTKRRTSFNESTARMEVVSEGNEDAGRDILEKLSVSDDDEQSTRIRFGNQQQTDAPHDAAEDNNNPINFEKKCPMLSCQLRHVDSFMETLPRYMQASPFSTFEMKYENYELCTPEQLFMLKGRLDEKKKREKMDEREEVDSEEWKPEVLGVGVQTSDLSYLDVGLPPCTCRDSLESSETDPGNMYKMEDLIPIKENLDEINKDCFWKDHIQFNRFKVIGEDYTETGQTIRQLTAVKNDFARQRMHEIGRILKDHPSLLDLFQANTRC